MTTRRLNVACGTVKTVHIQRQKM